MLSFKKTNILNLSSEAVVMIYNLIFLLSTVVCLFYALSLPGNLIVCTPSQGALLYKVV